MATKQKKILIIDDEPAILDALGAFLRHSGYGTDTITEYENYFDGSGNQSLPDLIILDILLMDEDGRKIAKALKRGTTTKNIPIIMISAHPKATKTALKAGADIFMAKPFGTEELLANIKQLLSA